MYFREKMMNLYDVEENNPEHMNNNCQFNSSDPDLYFELKNKTIFLQSFQLSTTTTVRQSEQLRLSSSAAAFAPCIQLLDSVSEGWNSTKENSLQSVTEDHKEITLGSDYNFGQLTETYNVPNYSDTVVCFQVETPSSIESCSDFDCCLDVPRCCDVLNSSDNLSCSGGTTSSIGWDVVDQRSVLNCQLGVRHRNSGLFSIDLCSLVGQRYLQYQSTCSNFCLDDEFSYDLYCQWPMVEDTSRLLRPRPEPYPVTFKKEVNSSSFTHLYRFSRAEQMEFARKVGHLVNRRSRKLLSQMKRCSVPLARLPIGTLTWYKSCQPVVCVAPLSNSVIKKWSKKKRDIQSSSKRDIQSSSAMSRKHCKRSIRRVFPATSDCPIVPLSRCDFQSTKTSQLIERRSAKRVPLSCLNRSENVSGHCREIHRTAVSDASLLTVLEYERAVQLLHRKQ